MLWRSKTQRAINNALGLFFIAFALSQITPGLTRWSFPDSLNKVQFACHFIGAGFAVAAGVGLLRETTVIEDVGGSLNPRSDRSCFS
mmetsp:Transcript_71910/g.214617  ORF Transcript_71910/g.214617 Transcript_71910/m.214617 type:complete len:87 (-) Transcript_71910:18-278(-)